MDRATTLAALDPIIVRGGALALFGDATPGGEWPALLGRLGEEFAPAKAAERRARKQTEEPPEVVLLRPLCVRVPRAARRDRGAPPARG